MSRAFKDQCPFPNEVWTDDWFRRLGLEEVFPDRPDAPLEVDLGSGDGGFLLAMAEKFPDRNFLGVERLLGRVRKVCREIEKRGLSGNTRVLRIETGYAINWLLPQGRTDRAHLLFPDPWPKKKHHKRRLMCQPEFLRSVRRLLKPGGELFFKTDHPDYFGAAEECLDSVDFFERLDWPEDDEAFFYAVTGFEQLWLAEGRAIQGLRLRRL